jgi:HEAT repeat protein
MLLRAIWLTSVALAALSVAGMLLLIVRRMILARSERKRGQLRDALMVRVVDYLDGTGDYYHLVRLAGQHPDIAGELIGEMRQLVRGAHREKLSDLVVSLGIVAFNLKRLRSRDARQRRLAAAWLAVAPGEGVIAALEAALDDPDYHVRLEAVRSLTELRAVRSVIEIVEKLGGEAQYNSRVLYHIFRQLVPELSGQLVELLHSGHAVPIKVLALDALGKSGDGALVGPISALADDPSEELRAKALRSLGELGYPDASPFVLRALDDESWRVRTQAANCAGRIGCLAAIPRLTELLGDEQWWVSYRAAEALYVLGEEGRRALADAAARPGHAGRVSELIIAEKTQMAA